MLLNNADTPAQAPTPSDAGLLTEKNTRAAQGALTGIVMLYTAGERKMPEWLKVGLFIAGAASVMINVSKLDAPKRKGAP